MEKLTWSTEKRRIRDLIPASYNPRRLTEQQAKDLRKSLERFDLVEIPAIDTDGTILAGHQRLGMLQAMGRGEETIDVRVPSRKLTDSEAKEYNLRSNKNTGEWDMDKLFEMPKELLEDVGFSNKEIQKLIDGHTEAKEDEYDVDAGLEKPVRVARGEIWQLGRHRLMCGDSTSKEDVESLMDGKKADMVFTDPPYGVDYDGGHATEKRREKLVNDNALDMYDVPLKMANAYSVEDAPLYLWFADRYAEKVLDGLRDAGYSVRNWIIWNKSLAQFGAIGAQYKSKHEPCIYAFKTGGSSRWNGPNNEVTVWDVKRESKNEYHPTQKPLDLIVRAVKNHETTSVLDLFGGSGSTLIACEQTNRVCHMMEIDPKYCTVIIDRWEKLTGQKAVKL